MDDLSRAEQTPEVAMTKIRLSALMFLSLAALAASEGAQADSVRGRAAPRHMSLRAAEPMAGKPIPAPTNVFDSGTQIAIKIQDGHHGEGVN